MSTSITSPDTRPRAATAVVAAHAGVLPTDAPTLVASLAEEHIVCSLRDENLRVAAHFYNTDDDIDTLLEALGRRRHLLA